MLDVAAHWVSPIIGFHPMLDDFALTGLLEIPNLLLSVCSKIAEDLGKKFKTAVRKPLQPWPLELIEFYNRFVLILCYSEKDKFSASPFFQLL